MASRPGAQNAVRFSDAPPGGACPLSRDAPSVHNLNPLATSQVGLFKKGRATVNVGCGAGRAWSCGPHTSRSPGVWRSRRIPPRPHGATHARAAEATKEQYDQDKQAARSCSTNLEMEIRNWKQSTRRALVYLTNSNNIFNHILRALFL